MNKLLLTFFLLVALIPVINAQIPDGYYNDAENKSGSVLKEALYNIIKGHTEKSYGDARFILDEADADPNIEGNVLLIYCDSSVSGEWDAGETWNREHVWAKSRGDFGTEKPAGSDLHNLRACNPQMNSDRSNRWFGESDAPYKLNGIETGSYISTTSWFWEPRDEDKGDVARIMFYMATRYEGNNNEPDLELIDYVPDNNFTKDPIFAMLSELLQWHIDDPVSDFERNRNEVIYGHQKNRNPFIDRPDFVDLIWGSGNSILNKQGVAVKVFPNPSNGRISIEASLEFESLTVYNIIGREIISMPYARNIDISNLPNGTYLLKLNGSGTNIVIHLVIQP